MAPGERPAPLPGCQPCTRHDDTPARDGDVWLSLERVDEDNVPGPVQVAVLAGSAFAFDELLPVRLTGVAS